MVKKAIVLPAGEGTGISPITKEILKEIIRVGKDLVIRNFKLLREADELELEGE